MLSTRSTGDLVRNVFSDSKARSVVVTISVGVITGCWVAYILLYPISSLPLPRYTIVAVVLLGWYIDYFARSMLACIGMVIGSSTIAYISAFVAYTLPALLGWHSGQIIKRSLYVSGFKQVLIYTLPAVVLLIVGTAVTYVLRHSYDEITR